MRRRAAGGAALDGAVLGAVALGGALGAGARYGVAVALPTGQDGFPWATLWTNVAGCALMGVFMALLDEARRPHRLLRPLVGTGMLGGFTTFSAYALETRALLEGGRAVTAFAYLAGTLVAALLAVAVAAWATRGAVALVRRRRAA
ncbi:chromosome condensation protein CrcB [Streptomyces thermolilacinus SPC6]|uniref:Fluoride-specific ion channel FluC n=1 Tax=Streptomyces thermolilacinus SPC6 TaxID=1306406 RepID=A0A1D3E0H7_9ACTN|nr:chromosome condensation protein CrcB [Streptomyces thermolilacinus SPC6]